MTKRVRVFVDETRMDVNVSGWSVRRCQTRDISAVFAVYLLLKQQARNGRYFQIKSPSLRTQFWTPMGCNVKLLFWRQIRCHCSQPNFQLHLTSHVYAYPQIYGRILNIIHKYWRVLLDRNLLSPYFNFSTFFPTYFNCFFHELMSYFIIQVCHT